MNQTKANSVQQEVSDGRVESLTELETEELLRQYRETGDADVKWALVLQHVNLVRMIASQIHGIFSDFAQLDDMIHEGVLVLLDAVDKYDVTKGTKFSTYVSRRIRGMIVDLARRQNWSSRQIRQRATRINQLEQELYHEFGRAPTNQEMAERLGMTVEKYEETLADIAISNLMSFEMLLDTYGGESMQWVRGIYGDTESALPEDACEEQEMRIVLAEGIRQLRENEQTVLSLYYEKEMKMNEIAQILNVSAPRVSQIHSKAIQKLRTHMEQYMEENKRAKERETCKKDSII